VDFESFRIYGFSIMYPSNCRLELSVKSRRDTGDIIFHFPDKVRIFLSWGELRKALKKFQTAEEHAEHSLSIVKKSGNVKSFERVSQDSLNICSHRGVYNHVELEEASVSLFAGSRRTSRVAYSVHVHCPSSSRYFVIYTLLPGTEAEYEKIVLAMANSLSCH
jgi:hypothetical protein